MLPGGRDDYVSELRRFVLRLYDKASPADTRYFLDKTPRYHLVADEIITMFPESKCIFLWRNPLAVIASIIETWGSGKWNIYRFKVDLFDGVENLVQTYQKHRDTVHSVRYEALIASPDQTLREVFRYLELPFDPTVLDLFSGVELRGRWGDQSGIEKYDRVSNEPLEGWRRTLNSPFRRAWCRRYLRWIGRDRLALMGYDLEALIDDLDALPVSYERIGSDLGRGCWGLVRDVLEPKILQDKLSTLPSWHRVHVHK
jgi:hypothetical protein